LTGANEINTKLKFTNSQQRRVEATGVADAALSLAAVNRGFSVG